MAEPAGAPEGEPLFPVRTALAEFVAETGYQSKTYPECWGFAIVKVA
jgi:hypothetical protein